MEQPSGGSQRELSKLLSSWPDNQVSEFGQRKNQNPSSLYIWVQQAFIQSLVKHKC